MPAKSEVPSRDEIAMRLFMPPLLILVIAILKALTAGYMYPRQDLIIYTTFLYARQHPELFARDVFAELRHAHFDFFWYFAAYLPDIWLDGDVMKNLAVLTWTFMFYGLYLFTGVFTSSMFLRLVPVLYLAWTKVTVGRLALLEYSFSHRQICYGLCFIGLALFFRERRSAGLLPMSAATLLYPPLIYYVWVPFGIFLVYEFGWKEAARSAALAAAVCSPLLYRYLQSGVLASFAGGSGDVEWKKYFFINFDSLFSFFPLTGEKIFYMSGWLGCSALIALLWCLRDSYNEVQRRYVRMLAAFLAYSVVGAALSYFGVGFAVRMQLIRASVITAMLTLVASSFLLGALWGERKKLEKFCAVLPFLSHHFLVVFAAFINFVFPSRSPLRYLTAACILIAVDQTHAVFGSAPIMTRFSPWGDVAAHARASLPPNALVMIPPVAGTQSCNLDDQASFRLLSLRSTTLKVSDGVEVGYDLHFASEYVNWLHELRDFLDIEFDFSSDCAFRQKIGFAWNRLGLKGQLVFARAQGADYLLIRNDLLPGGSSPEAEYRGRLYSLVKVLPGIEGGINDAAGSGSIRTGIGAGA